MPQETPLAVEYAFEQIGYAEFDAHMLVHHVRAFFNDRGVEYQQFCYEDLVPYLPQ